MNNENLKTKTIKSMLWTAIQRFGVLFISFITNLIFAYFLSPNDFGTIGMLTIFITLSETFIDSGFGAALIQKKDPTEDDYSTVFWTNISISIIIYLLLFFSAPLISTFYKMQILTPILRIKAITLIIQGFRLIQTTRLQKSLNFKYISLIYLFSAIISSIISIISLFFGFGIWALVLKTILDTLIKTSLLWFVGKWKPKFIFNRTSFKELFSYGGVMLSTSLIITLYSNMQTLIIGKVFSATELGFYTQASKLESIPTNALEQMINQVTFPVFSQLKDDINKMKNGLKNILISVSYISFPMMIFCIICAAPIFNFLFKPIWEPAIPYFRYLCLVGMMVSVNTMNTNLVKATGKKGLYFKLQVIKRIIGMILIILSIYFGMSGILIARVLIEYCFFIINAKATKKTIEYHLFEQIKDLFPNYILSIITGIITFLLFRNMSFITLSFKIEMFLIILLQFIFYTLLFIFISYLFKFKGFIIYKDLIYTKIIKRKTNNGEKNN